LKVFFLAEEQITQLGFSPFFDFFIRTSVSEDSKKLRRIERDEKLVPEKLVPEKLVPEKLVPEKNVESIFFPPRLSSWNCFE
jgi:hypothetical protein